MKNCKISSSIQVDVYCSQLGYWAYLGGSVWKKKHDIFGKYEIICRMSFLSINKLSSFVLKEKNPPNPRRYLQQELQKISA